MAFQRTTNLDLLLNVAIPLRLKYYPNDENVEHTFNTTMTIEKIVEEDYSTYLLIGLDDNRGFYKIEIFIDELNEYCVLKNSLKTTIDFLTSEVQYEYLKTNFPQYYQEEGE